MIQTAIKLNLGSRNSNETFPSINSMLFVIVYSQRGKVHLRHVHDAISVQTFV